MRAQLRRFTLFLLWGGLLYALNTTWGTLPPLGHLLNPFKGAWQNGVIKKERDLIIPGLKSKVHVQWDESGVPHVFAENNHDLYFAQGYLHAKDRLFQMDLAARAGGGRLSELVGEKALDMDKYFVTIGMREGSAPGHPGLFTRFTNKFSCTILYRGH